MFNIENHNVIIHKSHTKQYLIKIIQLLNIPIKYNEFTKDSLLEEMDGWILENYDTEFTDNFLELNTCMDLMEFLALPAEKEHDYKTVKDRQHLLLKAKQLLAYVNNGQDIDRSFYKDSNEPKKDALILAQQGGDIPSCRRAVYKYNAILPPKNKIVLHLNKYTMEEMKTQLKTKKMKQPIFKKKTGNFNIIFN